jgi:hypothetical protein
MARRPIYPEPMQSDSNPQIEAKPRTTRSKVLLAAYVALVGWLFYGQSTSWPHEGSWAFMAYVFLCPGILFQSVNLAYTWRTGRALARRALTRVVTIPLGLVFAALLGGLASDLAMHGFEEAYAPFVSQIGANLADPCAPGAKYFALRAVAAFNAQTGSRPTAYLHHDDKRFVLGFAGGSIDIDGSTIYYDSGAKEWLRYHNDRLDARAVHQKLTEGLPTCKLRAAPAG